jgi:non-ribosomal peptide synthetase component F
MSIEYAKTAGACFDIQVSLTPNATAVSNGATQLSYLELNEKANQLAHWLKKKSIGQGDVIALLFEPEIEFIVAVIAAIKVGGIYLTIDSKTSLNRIDYMVRDSKAKILISNIRNAHHRFGESDFYYWENIIPELTYIGYDGKSQRGNDLPPWRN